MQGISLNLIYNSHMNSDPLCPKCRHPFSQDLPPKKLINCSHSLCHACLVNELSKTSTIQSAPSIAPALRRGSTPSKRSKSTTPYSN